MNAVKRLISSVILCVTLPLSGCTTASLDAQDASQWKNCRPPVYCGPAVNYEAHGESY